MESENTLAKEEKRHLCDDCIRTGVNICLFEKYWLSVKWCMMEGIDVNDFSLEHDIVVDIDINVLRSSRSTTDNSILRKEAYRAFTILCHGYLGRGNRVQLPKCVTDGVRKHFPSDDGMYMGYHNHK